MLGRHPDRILTLLPFALVVALALGLGTAGLLATRAARAEIQDPASSGPVAALTLAPSGGSLPSSAPPATASASSSRANDAVEMLRVHNALRQAVAAPAVRADDRVTAAAQKHAEYLARNNMLGHEESSGDPGFSGVSVRDRLAAQGYPGATASEVATSFGAGTDGVRSLWVLPYHRLGLMHPHAIVAGWGHAAVGGRSTTVGVIVYDFGSPAPDLVRSPAAGQSVPPSWEGEEFPDVLPAGAARPVGYPVLLVYSKARSVELRAARLTDASGREIAHHVVPQIYERDYVAIVPAAALARAMRYHVRLQVSLAGVEVVDEWDFQTDP